MASFVARPPGCRGRCGMASRKAKPTKKPSRAVTRRRAHADAPRAQPREVEVVDSSARSVPPPPPTTTRVLDDLAETVEAPAVTPRVLLLDAGEIVFSKLGYAQTTDAEVARSARLSLDVFHAHFANK